MARRASSVSSALSKIRNQRTGKTSALDEYEVEDENDRIYEVITEEEYNERNRKRRLDDFIEGGDFSDDEIDDDLDDIEDQVDRTLRRGSQKPHPSGKSIQQHFVEMAASSTTYQPSKHVENDASVLKKLSSFEDELDNEGGAYGSLPGQFSMPSQLGMQPLHTPFSGMPLMPGSSLSHLPTRSLYSGPLSVPMGGLGVPGDGMRDLLDQPEDVLDESQEIPEAEIDPSLIETFGEVESASQIDTVATQDTQDASQEVINIDAIRTDNESDIPFYILDLCEGPVGDLYLFGRILSNRGESTESCMVTVKNVMRCLFFKPRMDLMFTETGEITDMLVDGVVLAGNPLFERHLMKNFYNEMEVLRKDYGIKKIMYKLVKRKLLKYGPSNEELYIKVCYPYAFPQLGKHHFTGTCYSDVYGVGAPIHELFLIKRKIKGPSWLRLRGAVVGVQNLSTCKVELEVESHKSVSLWVSKDSEEIPVPQISIAAISVKTCFVTPNQPEIFEIAMVYNKKCSIDDMTAKTDNQFIGIRKLPSLQWPKEMKAFLSKRPYFRIYEQERGMLAHFMKFLETIDPDVVVSHDTHQLVLEPLLKRCNALNIPLRVSFSRLKLGKKMSTPFTAGRLFCDTRMLTKELYHGRGNYDLSACVSDLVTKTPPKDSNFYTRNGFTMGEVKRCFGDAPEAMKNLLVMAQANSKFALDSFNLLLKIQALPLTKELTNIAGNTWSRSIQCARSERNDFLLMHEFHRHKFILDHTFEKHTGTSKNVPDDEDKKGKRGSYEGGLVFEPISGLYDNFVLLLDFNSLYPSIIQEFNICFTTAVVEEGEGDPKVEILNDVTGMLPQILRRLVDLRFSVKSVLASEKNETRKVQLGVRQLALKLAANSLYGCLGSVYSRFHAKHLAAYITQQGRTVLRSTKEKVENSFNLQVIYGDTDSLMINTNIKDDGQLVNFEAANGLAKTIISTVNKGHKKLEIGIDGIFSRLLLLKKKKYAALKVNDYSEKSFSREIKGLDFIRRDWSLLTKEVGNALLSIILNANYGSGVDGIVEQIHETLRDVNERIKDGKIPTRSWLITRQLTKNPKEYADVQNLPHVSVALRLNEKGLTNYSAGHEVSFIICSRESIEERMMSIGNNVPKGDAKTLSARAFALSEVEEFGLSPDIGYYKTQQLFPPILRLCGLIEGTDAQRLAKCLELESSANLNVIASGTNSFEFAEQESRALALIKRTEEHYREYLKCNHCKSWMPIHLLKNWIDRALYEVALQACFCIRICNICNTTTLNVCLGAQDVCPQPTCQSSDSMEVVLTSSKIYLYYDYLVFMLEGSLKDPEEDEDVTNSLVNATVDYDGKMTVLYNSEPFKDVKKFDDVLKDIVEQNTLKATSGLRVCAQHILGIIEALPFLQYYTLDYAKERENLCQKVKILQQKHAYSVVNLCDVFGVFNTKRTINGF